MKLVHTSGSVETVFDFVANGASSPSPCCQNSDINKDSALIGDHTNLYSRFRFTGRCTNRSLIIHDVSKVSVCCSISLTSWSISMAAKPDVDVGTTAETDVV